MEKMKKIWCNAKWCIDKLNILRVFDTENYRFSLLIGALFIVGGVVIATEFKADHVGVIAESVGFGLHALGMLPFISLIANSRPSARFAQEVVKFHRRGYFITTNSSPTQCTLQGWKGYRYKVTMEAGSKFDDHGFLIDHNKLHKVITEWVKNEQMLSCELTLQKLCYVLGEVVINNGVELQKLGLEIAPIDYKLLEEGPDGELVPKQDLKPEQIMPAGAEYWCEFPKKKSA